MGQSGKRRRWTAAEKLRLVLAGLDGSIGISELCRREGINPTQFHGWKNQLLRSASRCSTVARRVVPTRAKSACRAS
jgi:transposase-like protein